MEDIFWEIEKRKLYKMVENYHFKKGKNFEDATRIYLREMEPYYKLNAEVNKIIENEPLVLRWAYRNFSFRSFKLLREKREKELKAYFNKWVKEGLNEKILKKIIRKIKEFLSN